MKEYKKVLSVILMILTIFNSCSISLAKEDNDYHYLNPNGILVYQNNDESEEFDQEILNEINNNPIGNNTSIDNLQISSNTEIISEINESTLRLSSADDSSSVNSEFYVEPVNNPYYSYNNNNEYVSLDTGEMNFEKNLLSLPGKNGLDLNLNIKYSSGDAVMTQNEYLCVSNREILSFNTFAIGWSFAFPTIIRNGGLYGNSYQTSIKLADGRTYKLKFADSDNFVYNSVTKDTALEMIDYDLEDMKMTKLAADQSYVLEYSDGTKDYFNSGHGGITKRVDRFGNTIKFEYTVQDYYSVSFNDYILAPNMYLASMYLLSKITDSTGRKISIEYNGLGKNLSSIDILVNDVQNCSLKFKTKHCYNGDVAVLSSITDAEGYVTEFEYEEQQSHIYCPIYTEWPIPEPYTYNIYCANYLMNKITYPTGGSSKYTYVKARRSYHTEQDYGEGMGWYDVFKVNEHTATTGAITAYYYQGDRSGYPYSYDCISNYHTIVQHNGFRTIYTFNSSHDKIREEKYAMNYTDTSYIPSDGPAEWSAVLGNSIYRISQVGSYIYAYTHETPMYAKLDFHEYTEDQYKDDYSRNKIVFLKPYKHRTYDLEIMSVKTYDSKILLFCRPDLIGNDYTYVLSVDWRGISLYGTIKCENFIPDFYYNNEFYMISEHKNMLKLVKFGEKLQYIETPMPIATEEFNYVCNSDNYAFFYGDGMIFRYDFANNTIDYKIISSSIQYKGGFVYSEDLYLWANDGINKYDFDSGAIIATYPLPDVTGDNDVMQKSTDGCAYYFSSACDEDAYMYTYRFTPEKETPWEICAFRIDEHSDFTVKMGANNNAFILTDHSQEDSEGENYIGIESIKLDKISEMRQRTDNTYIDGHRLESQTNIAFGMNDAKVVGQTQNTYVENRKLISSTTDVMGNVSKYEYTDSPYDIPTKITQYSDTDNEVITTNNLSEDKTKIISSITSYDDRSIKTEYVYDDINPGNVISKTIAEISSENIDNATEEDWMILSQTEYVYDSSGVFITQEKKKGIITNDSSFETMPEQDMIISYSYDDYGRLLSYTDAANKSTYYEYNKLGWLLKTTYPDGTFTSNEYRILQDNSKTITSYNDEYHTFTYYDSAGRTTETGIIDENMNEIQLEKNAYSVDGNLYWTEYANGGRTYYYYNDLDERTIAINKDSDGNELFRQNLYHLQYEMAYESYYGGICKIAYHDEAGNITEEIHDTPSGISRTKYEYNSKGELTKTTNSLGNTTTNTYNDLGQLLSVTDAIGQSTLYEYDEFGNVSKVIYSGGNTLSYEYDNLGRLLKTTDVLGNTEHYSYDANGNLVTYKDKNGNVTTNTYDTMNRLLTTKTGDIQTSYTYDNLGNVLTMTDSTGTTDYSYNYRYELESISTPDGKEILYDYDIVGNISSMTDYAGNSYTYTYDGMNRLDKIMNEDGIIADYAYTDFNKIDTITYPDTITSYTYDNTGWLTSVTNEQINGYTLSENTYEYDVAGNIIKETSGVCDPDTYVICSSEKCAMCDECYQPGGCYTCGKCDECPDCSYSDEIYWSGNTINYTYDNISRLIGVKRGNEETSYTFDAANNIMTKSITHPSTYEFSFIQDGEEHTINNISTHNYTYSYDKANRLMTSTESIAGTGDTYSGYLEIVNSFTYDNNGNTLSKTTGGQVDESVVQYGYNERNQLVSYTDSDGNITNYGYDGTGMRVSKIQGDTTQKFYWDRGYIVNEATNGIFSATNTIGTNGVIERADDAGKRRMMKNGHGDVLLTYFDNSESKNIFASSYEYNEYGQHHIETVDKSGTEDVDNPFRYCGEYYDAESGLIYLRNRYYDPSMGRFITEDPIMDGNNWYVYCGNNPVNFVDPFGLIVTAWDRAHCTEEELQDLQTYTELWESGNQVQKALVAQYAEEIRKKYRENGEYGVGDGNTGKDGKVYDTYLYFEGGEILNSECSAIEMEIHYGVGLGATIDFLGMDVDVGGKMYYDLTNVTTAYPTQSMQLGAEIEIFDQISLGGEITGTINPATMEHLRNDGYVGLKVLDEVIGWSDLPYNGDVIFDLHFGSYFIVGGEVIMKFNITKLLK